MFGCAASLDFTLQSAASAPADMSASPSILPQLMTQNLIKEHQGYPKQA